MLFSRLGVLLDEIEPAIDFAATKYLVAWAHASLLGSGWNLSMVGLDRSSGVPCEAATVIDASSSTTDRFPEIAAKYSGSLLAGDEAVIVWESTSTTGDIKAQRVEAIGAGGAVTSLGGGCAGGGTAGVDGPVAIGNSNFAFTLSGEAGPTIGLALSAAQLNFTCGGCTLVPALDLFLTGSSPLALPIPCNSLFLGATLYAQWFVLAPSGCTLAPSFSFSQALRVAIGL